METITTRSTLKVCTNCTSAHRKVLRKSLRKCPSCGGNRFEPAPAEMVQAHQAEWDRMVQLANKLLAEED